MRRILLPLALLVALAGCAPKVYYTPDFEKFKPKSVLVLPPENTTSNTEVLEKSYPFVFSSLAQRGYYAIAPELALQLFEANKLNDPARINTLPTQKFAEVFGVDAVLRTKVTEWSSKYIVISSTVNVGYSMELLDAKTGTLLWKMDRVLSKAPDNSGNNVFGALINAAIHAAATPYEPIAQENAVFMANTIPQGEVHAQKN